MLFTFLRTLPWLAKLSPVLVSIKGQWKTISFVISAASIAFTFLWIQHLNNKISAAEGNYDIVKGQLIDCQMVNDDQMGTIVDLVDANDALASLVRVSHAQRDAAEASARERASQAASELSEILTELEDLRNANPTCAQISGIDLGAACPAVIQRLRDEATSSDN